jgi:hypothetical protein
MSPLLFNLFINDRFSDSAGVRVPGLPDGRVGGLKYFFLRFRAPWERKLAR